MSWRTRPAASSSSPVLSESEISTRRMGTRSVIRLPSTGAAELPADFTADARHLADDHQLRRVACDAGAVDEQAFLDGQHRTPTAEIPRRSAARAQDRAHGVSGQGRLDVGGEMEAGGEGDRVADLAAAFLDQLVGAAQLLAVIAEHQAALVDQAEAADV